MRMAPFVHCFCPPLNQKTKRFTADPDSGCGESFQLSGAFPGRTPQDVAEIRLRPNRFLINSVVPAITHLIFIRQKLSFTRPIAS